MNRKRVIPLNAVVKIYPDHIDYYDPNEDCPICFEPLGPHENVSVYTPCGHCFHTRCMRDSLETCPMCRTPVTTYDKMSIDGYLADIINRLYNRCKVLENLLYAANEETETQRNSLFQKDQKIHEFQDLIKSLTERVNTTNKQKESQRDMLHQKDQKIGELNNLIKALTERVNALTKQMEEIMNLNERKRQMTDNLQDMKNHIENMKQMRNQENVQYVSNNNKNKIKRYPKFNDKMKKNRNVINTTNNDNDSDNLNY